MPVIGRLDEQVHEVLIGPVSKRRRGEGRPDEPRWHEDEPDGPPSLQKPPRDESRAGRDELPVWLL